MTEYPYKGYKVRAFFAGGNGGQIVMGIPELDLVIGFYGGNYSDQAALVPQRVLIPELILPAVNSLVLSTETPQRRLPAAPLKRMGYGSSEALCAQAGSGGS